MEINIGNEHEEENPHLEEYIHKAFVEAILGVCKRNESIDVNSSIQLELNFLNFYLSKDKIKKGNHKDFINGILKLEEVSKYLEKFSKKYEDLEVLKKLSSCYDMLIAFQDFFIENFVLDFKKLPGIYDDFNSLNIGLSKGNSADYLVKNYLIKGRIKDLEGMAA